MLKIILRLVFSVILLGTANVFAALPSGLKTVVEAEAVAVIAAIESVQTTHIGSNSRYWQGSSTHTVIPADGAAIAPDTSAKPTGGESWADKSISLPGGTKSSYEVQEYEGPNGVGYTINQKVTSGGDTYMRIIDRGSENRDEDWFLEDLD